MSREGAKNSAASIRQRLLNRAREDGEEFQLVLIRYGIERLVFRLSRSPHAHKFILKGATLFYVWNPKTQAYRPTRDLDFLMRGENSIHALETIFREVIQMDVIPDGLVFDPASVQVTSIREDNRYGGKRVMLLARLENARISIQIDIGFGDKITPAPEEITFPSLLGQETSHLSAYPKETVIAEKLEAMVTLGEANSRMKDFYDIHFLSKHYTFSGQILSQAMTATFTGRHTPLPEGEVYSLTDAFSADHGRQRSWIAFLNRTGLKEVETSFQVVTQQIAAFVQPPLHAAGKNEAFSLNWTNAKVWR